MANGDDKGINLLPADLRQRRERVQRAIRHEQEVVYTDPKNGHKKKPGFLSRLFARRKQKQKKEPPARPKEPVKQSAAPHDLPSGSPLPSGLFSSASRQESPQPQLARKEPVYTPQPKQPSPRMVSAPAKPAAPVASEKQQDKNKKSEKAAGGMWRTFVSLFGRKKKQTAPMVVSGDKERKASVSLGHTPSSAIKHVDHVEYTAPAESSQGVPASEVQTMHEPDFLHSRPITRIEDEVLGTSEKKPAGLFARLRGIFSRKKKPILPARQIPKKPSLAPAHHLVKPKPPAAPSKTTVSIQKVKSLVVPVPQKPQSAQYRESALRRIIRKLFGKRESAQKPLPPAGKSAPDLLHQSAKAAVLPGAHKPQPLSADRLAVPAPAPQPKAAQQNEKSDVLAAGLSTPRSKPAPAQPAPMASKSPQPGEQAKTGMAKKVAESSQKGLTEAPVHRRAQYDVNLLTQEYSQTFNERSPVTFLIGWSVATIFVMVLLYVSLALYQMQGSARVSELKRINTTLKETIATYGDIDAEDQAIRSKVSIVDKLLETHVSWNAFLTRLEEVTIPEVTYSSFAAATDGSVIISALATNYGALARQMTVFKEAAPWIKEFSITSAALATNKYGEVDGVGFDIIMTVDVDIVHPRKTVSGQ